MSGELPRNDLAPAVALTREGEDGVGPGVDRTVHAAGEVDAQERECRIRHRVDQPPAPGRSVPASGCSTHPGTGTMRARGVSPRRRATRSHCRPAQLTTTSRRDVAGGGVDTSVRRPGGSRRRPGAEGQVRAASLEASDQGQAHLAVVDDAGAGHVQARPGRRHAARAPSPRRRQPGDRQRRWPDRSRTGVEARQLVRGWWPRPACRRSRERCPSPRRSATMDRAPARHSPGLERAGRVVEAGVDDAAVVAGLVRRPGVSFSTTVT